MLKNMVTASCEHMKKQDAYQSQRTEKEIVSVYLQYRQNMGKKKQSNSNSLFAKPLMLVRRVRYIKFLLNPVKLIAFMKLIGVYGYHRAGSMYQIDPALQFNSIALSSQTSPYYESYQHIEETLNHFPEI